MKTDISSRKDIDFLIKTFYDKLLQDDLLQHIFRQTILPDLEAHLKTIADFWDSILLDADIYRGNVTEKHIALDKKFTLSKNEFDRWLLLWKQTIDALFSGEKSEMAKFRAQSIADIMQYKIEYLRSNK
ncbi:MAG: globin [Bacteroidota bacterium]|nr:globin [Bacteroidota bacterium]